MVNRTTRMILAVALAAPIATLAQTNGLPRPAYVVSNAYVEIRSSRPLWRNGGLDFLTVTNAAPPLDMVVTPMPGWELLTPSELHITDGHAGMWSVRGVLGETGAGGEMCIPMTTSNDTHRVAPSFKLPPPSTGSGGSGPSAESLPPISSGGPYVVASTSDTAMVSFSCAPTDLTNGVHECHTSFFSCPGGKTNEERKGPAREYQTLFDRFTWVWSCAGTTNTQEGLALRAVPLELHAGDHPVLAELEARYSGCVKCVYSDKAETNIVVSLLTVTCDPWIGLDRTGDPATPYESSNVTARASLDPANPGVAKVEWTYAGVCDRTEKRDWEMDVWTTSREKCSGSYLEERVTAAACGASASTNFTVVKVDVEINGLDETAEEAVGAYLAYVADTNGVMTAAGTNAMVGVKFTCTPADLPPDEMVIIRNPGHGELYLKEGEALYLVTATNIPACQIGGKTFLLHGHTASGDLKDSEITIKHPSSKAIDRAFYTVVEVEMEIYKPKVVDASETMIPKSDKLSVGSVTFVNLDNDDRDERYDLYETTPDDDVSGGDDELVKLRLKVRPTSLTGGMVKLLAVSGGGTVAAWTRDTKTTAYSFGTPIAVPAGFSTEDGWLAKTLWIEGVSPHAVQCQAVFKMEYALSDMKAADEAALTVVGVESISWKGMGNSLNNDDSLDHDPNWPSGLSPAALRVFPGARVENGAVGEARDIVGVEVSLSVAPPHPVNVYLRSFDVDDPTDATAPVDNEADEEDNRGMTPAQSGQFTNEASDGVLALPFPANTVNTTCEFQVTMQPGDNFRIVANGDRNFLLDLENVDYALDIGASEAEKNANKQRICNKYITGTSAPSVREIRQPSQYASPTLTVWRFLHIEADSMAAPPSSGPEKNLVDGHLTRIDGDGIVARRAFLSENLRTGLTPNDNSDNMTSSSDKGRFENGWIKIGSGTGTPGQTQTSGLDGNGDDFVVKTAGIDIPVVVSKTGLPDITAKAVKWSGLDFTLGGLSANLSTLYEGGTINVVGVSETINSVDGSSKVTVEREPTIPFVLHDDDDDSVLPHTLSVNAEAVRIFGKAYVFPIKDGAGDIAYNRNDVPFVRNVNRALLPTVFSFSQSIQSSRNRLARFWCGYALYAFQPSATPEQIGPIGIGNPQRGDRDPDSEADLNGLRLPNYGTALFIAPINELGVMSSEQRLLAHEIAHQFGVPDSYINGPSPPDCIMGNGLYFSGAKFYPEAQDIIRSRVNSPQ